MAAAAGTPSEMPRYFRLPLHAAPGAPGDRQGWVVAFPLPAGTQERFWGEGEHPVRRGAGTGAQPLPSALVWKRHQALQVPSLSSVTSQTPTL